MALSLSLVAGGEPYMASQMPGGGIQEMYGRPASGMGMAQCSQYPYGPGYDRRWAPRAGQQYTAVTVHSSS